MKLLNITYSGIAGMALCAALVQASPPQSATPHVSVDGQLVNFPDLQPKFMNNHVMVPMRGVFERMHASVDWNASARRITCVKDTATVQLTLGDNVAMVNGQRIQFDSPAMLSHGRTLVPLQFLAQSLGAKVQWDEPTQTVQISTPEFAQAKG